MENRSSDKLDNQLNLIMGLIVAALLTISVVGVYLGVKSNYNNKSIEEKWDEVRTPVAMNCIFECVYRTDPARLFVNDRDGHTMIFLTDDEAYPVLLEYEAGDAIVIEYGGKKFGTELYRYCSDGKTYYLDYQGFATFTN